MFNMTHPEIAAEVASSEDTKMYAKVRASLDALGFVKNLIGDFLYTDPDYLGDESAAAMLEGIRMRMGFIREALALVPPSLDTIEEYLAMRANEAESSNGD